MNATRVVARAMALVWAAFWFLFGLASGLGEGLGPIGAVMHTVPGVIFLVSALIAWRWEAVGAVLLLLEAPMISGFFHVRDPALLAILPLPPLLAGCLFLAACRRQPA
jgi:hypothetical protein